jgi:hypothetical protein
MLAAWHSAKNRERVFAECPLDDTRQRRLCRVPAIWPSANHILKLKKLCRVPDHGHSTKRPTYQRPNASSSLSLTYSLKRRRRRALTVATPSSPPPCPPSRPRPRRAVAVRPRPRRCRSPAPPPRAPPCPRARAAARRALACSSHTNYLVGFRCSRRHMVVGLAPPSRPMLWPIRVRRRPMSPTTRMTGPRPTPTPPSTAASMTTPPWRRRSMA